MISFPHRFARTHCIRAAHSAMIGTILVVGGLSLAACSSHDHHHHDNEQEVVIIRDAHGWDHRGYYDHDRHWHGGYYDDRRVYHDDPRDWHH